MRGILTMSGGQGKQKPTGAGGKTMKYNKSEIMKEAWKLHRSYSCRTLTFGQCLSRAWNRAKEAAKLAGQKAQKFVDGMTIVADGVELTLNLWVKYGKSRIYINDNKRNNQGYIDIERMEAKDVRKVAYAQTAAEIALAIACNM